MVLAVGLHVKSCDRPFCRELCSQQVRTVTKFEKRYNLKFEGILEFDPLFLHFYSKKLEIRTLFIRNFKKLRQFRNLKFFVRFQSFFQATLKLSTTSNQITSFQQVWLFTTRFNHFQSQPIPITFHLSNSQQTRNQNLKFQENFHKIEPTQSFSWDFSLFFKANSNLKSEKQNQFDTFTRFFVFQLSNFIFPAKRQVSSNSALFESGFTPKLAFSPISSSGVRNSKESSLQSSSLEFQFLFCLGLNWKFGKMTWFWRSTRFITKLNWFLS
jgi:hypothetical protein